MTIRKGEDWGHPGPLPHGTVVVGDDRELHELLNAGPVPSYVGLLAGDLARTVSASGDRGRFVPGADVVIMPIDLGIAVFDGGEQRFVSHVVARRSWWRGRILVVANAQFLGEWDVGPRSHPNDGWLDVSDVAADMGFRQRVVARRRLPTAGHLPHPSIRTSRVREGDWTFDRPVALWLDGVKVGRTRSLRVSLLPDALTVCI